MSYIQAYIKGQFAALSAKDNKERLRFTVAGIKDNKPYDYVGTDYGTLDGTFADVVFFEQDVLELSRITQSRIDTITKNMTDYFAEVEEEDEANEHQEVVEKSEESEEVEKNEQGVVGEAEDNTEVLIKKAIKKGKFKKAQKLLDQIGGDKKLQKKLDKAMQEVE